jgi:AcrR family transcriptional regulator
MAGRNTDQRGRPRKPETTERIVKAAYKLLTTLPYSDVSLARIADEAGVTRPTLYRRWATREDLLMDAVRSAMKATNPEPPGNSDPAEALRQLLSHLIMTLTRRKMAVAIVQLAGAAPYEPSLRALMQSTEKWRREVIRHVVERCVDAGLIDRARSVDLIIDQLLGAIYFRLLLSHEPVTPELADALVDDLLR